MSIFQRNENSLPIKSKILGVQFGVMGPEEIIKHSVVEITSHETFERDEPVIKGLFDSRMGVLDIGKICSTCGLKNKECPGHFGHIILARPVFYQQFMSYVIKILKFICIRCSRILIDKSNPIIKTILKKSEKVRFIELHKLCSKIKRCGQDHPCGCGCRQPDKYYKGPNNIINLFAEWKKESLGEDVNSKKQQLYPEDIHTIFSRISDEDCHLMGLNPQWCRPEYLICTVLPVSPPAVRPSVRESSGTQRMDDDLTHKLCDILKTNKSLSLRINEGSDQRVIDDWTKLLQWNVATLVDNEIPGIPQAVHRSQRPIKSIIQRLKGKEGRIRSNLMGKRVDFSARSVITPDPNISIDELGVPMPIAMNLTFPEKVTKYNIEDCRKLIRNGHKKYPGVNTYVENKTGNKIHLLLFEQETLNELAGKISAGDILNRHLINGDIVLFNRQPSLHRMSMMGHKVRVMPGNTFRLNISVTTPYNADFDGDEMNMHVPQSITSRYEIENLASVPKCIISPRTNHPIISIVQDTLLGINKLTKSGNIHVRKNGFSNNGRRVITDKKELRMPNCVYTIDQVMNILARVKIINIDFDDLPDPKYKVKDGYKRNMWSGGQIFSLIIPKTEKESLNLRLKNNLYEEEDDANDETIVKIVDSVLQHGTLDKTTFNSPSKGLIHTIYNKFGQDECHLFLDNIQRIVTQFLILEGFSVGISDLIIKKEINERIDASIDEKVVNVNKLINEVHLGIFEIPPGKTTREYLESRVNNILNKANDDAAHIAGNEVDEHNRVTNMINAGSKGSKINVGSMMACLGQQNVDGKRIPYGFEGRTLPHYKKCDDSAEARGFVKNSFISGLNPQEYFFHAMAGREGLIDTAVKTSDTGYIQRKLIKSMEDLKADYNYSVRSSNGNIVQFMYGDDGMDSIKIEEIPLDILKLSKADIEKKYEGPTLDKILDHKKFLFEQVFKMKDIPSNVFTPVHFIRIINDNREKFKGNVSDKQSQYNEIEKVKEKCTINTVFKHNEIFNKLIDIYLHPTNLKGISMIGCEHIYAQVITDFNNAIINPGEMVGPIAAQSIGEPATQMTLNTFHYAGVASKSNVTRGIPRLKELLHVTANLKNPSTTIYLLDKYSTNQNKSKAVLNKMEYTTLKDIVNNTSIYYDPVDATGSTNLSEDKELLDIYNEFTEIDDDCKDSELPWVIRLQFDTTKIMDKGLLMEDISVAIRNWSLDIKCIFTDDNSENLIARLVFPDTPKKEESDTEQDQSDIISSLKNLEEKILNEVVIKGIPNITNIIMSNMNTDYINYKGDYICKNSKKYISEEGEAIEIDNWAFETDGVNLSFILCDEHIDFCKTFSNDILEMQRILGIEAARNTLLIELTGVISDAGEYVNNRHIQLLVDLMTCRGIIMPTSRQGINKGDTGPLAKMSFEDTADQIMKAGIFGDYDNLNGVSANIMMGQIVPCGTGNFSVLLDEEQIKNTLRSEDVEDGGDDYDINVEEYIDGSDDSDDDYCNDENLDFSFDVS